MKNVILTPVYHWLRNRWRDLTIHPPIGQINFGDLRRVKPISHVFGYNRGLPVDRYYIEGFLAHYANDIAGWVLEIGDNAYTRKFGGERVAKSDVLHVAQGNPQATIVGDLTTADHIPSNLFDCIILTQTLQFIYDVQAALATLYRILKPGGVLLATVPGITKIPQDKWGKMCCWSFTTLSVQRLFEEVFPASGITVEAHGNVLAAVAFLHGLAVKELAYEELDYQDPLYQVIIAIKAVKPG